MIVLGIDPGTASTGYGVVESAGSTMHAVSAGVIETRAGTPIERRLAEIHACVGDLLDEHRPAAVAIEELYFGVNVRTAFAVGQARGVVLLAAGSRGWWSGCSAWRGRPRPTTPPTPWRWRSATSTARR
jgi:crossover junction endodeoxyribonuclease RuvC